MIIIIILLSSLDNLLYIHTFVDGYQRYKQVDAFCYKSKHHIDINEAKYQRILSLLLDTTRQSMQDIGIRKPINNRLEDRKSILRLNQRRLPKQIINCRTDAQKALSILEKAYPHLQVSHELIEDDDVDCSYDSLLGILNYEECYSKKHDDIQIVDGKSIVAVFEVLRKANNVPAALEILRLTADAVQHNQEVLHIDEEILRDDKNELRRVYKAVISLLGHTSKRLESSCSSRLILYILQYHMPEVSKLKPGSEIYHAAINSLGKAGQCSALLDILEEMEQSSNSQNETNVPPIDKMSYQTAISSLARHGECREAIKLLYQMQDKGLVSDMSIYNELLIGIAKQAGQAEKDGEPWHKVSLKLLSEMEMNGIQPTEQTYNSIISACGKEGAWGDVARVTRLASSKDHDGVSKDKPPVTNTTNLSHGTTYFHNLLPFRKVGKGKDSWWEIGRYQHIIIGIQPHRNPMSNGMSMVFYDEFSGLKMGRILLKNTCTKMKKTQSEMHYCSSLVGMEVNKTRRGEGLSKVFVALWLVICLETNTYMRAALMNKPLIVHVLMGFNFMPQNGGSRVELIRLKNRDTVNGKNEDSYSPNFALYSPSAKSLQGLFSQRVLRTQEIRVMDHPPSPEERKNGSVIYLKTTFEHPIAVLDNVVDYTPPLNEESKVDTSREGSAFQRRLLVGKIDDVLGKGGADFSSNSTRLKRAFHYT